MKLHLPSPLRKALIMALAAVSVGVSTSAYAASRSDQLTRATYCDFGDNKGQYAVHGVNALLDYLREKDGIQITYLNDDIPTYVWDKDQPLINYDSRMDSGPGAAIGYNFLATVQHNGVLNPTFSASTIGGDKAIQYAGIEYRSSTDNQFLLVPGIDYKVTRLSKIITDVTGSGVYTGDYNSLIGKTWYRSGSGTMYKVSPGRETVRESGAYAYCIGGIMQITHAGLNAKEGQVDVRGVVDDSGSVVINKTNWWLPSDINKNGRDPLPFVIQAGDSGSPTWIYDSESRSYLYAGAMQSGEGTFFSQARYAGQWTEAVMQYFNRDINMPGTTTVHIGTANVAAQGHYDSANNVTSHPYQGKIIAEGGQELQTYQGLQTGAHTWKSLSNVKDNDNWYAYGNQYLNTGASLTYADLFETQDLVFRGEGGQTCDIVLDGDVDLGIGYIRFTNESTENGDIRYNLSNNGSGNFRLDTAGFIVDAGVDVYVGLNGTAGYAREWRKIGEGNLHITGNGDNEEILLNLGGSGSTYLERQGGYAAYNVLANNGTTVVINGENQIKRDFTFGYGGALLDMNGHDMEWNNDAAADGRFTIHALTDEALISNLNKGAVTKLTWTQGGQQEYLGSFADTEDGGVFQFIYNAPAADSRLILHSIYTDLGNAAAVDGEQSGIIVQNGTLALQGTNTLHAPGSLGASFSNARYYSAEDWHYADSKTDVTVERGTFELGHHARLTGDVTVKAGGTFLMREGTTHRYEYVEGGYTTMDTYTIDGFYGLKGDVNIESGGTMRIEFNKDADVRLTYGGSISGQGALEVNPGVIGGSVLLTADNTGHTGAKQVSRGGMLVDKLEALGDVSSESGKWKLTDSGFLVLDNPFYGLTNNQVLDYIHKESDGILALTRNTEQAYDLSNHGSLIIGAYENTQIHYGTSTETLAAQTDADGKKAWHLGGGGGELVVDFILKETDAVNGTDLILGADYAKGVVYLRNTANDFTGTIKFNGGVTLKYDDERALGNASFAVNYTNRVATPGGLGKIQKDSKGVLLVDRVLENDLDLREYGDLAIGTQADAEYKGNITVAENATYHFGGSTGKLVLHNALAAYGRNDLDVDGQTFSGGEIRVLAATSITGDVSVRGCDQRKASQPIEDIGDITLGLGVNDALSQANSVTLYRGGYLDMSGTTQTLKDLEMGAGSAVINTSGQKSTLTVNMTKALTWAGAMEADTVYVAGSQTLTMNGSAAYTDLYIQSGITVRLNGDNALSKDGTTHIQAGATLDANKKNTWGDIYVHAQGTLKANNAGFSGMVTLDNGTINIASGSLASTSTLISKGGTVVGKKAQINGMAYFTEGVTYFSLGEETAIQQDDYPSIAGTVSISKGATLVLKDGGWSFLDPALGWKYSISSAEFNVAETFEDSEGHVTKEEKGTLRVAGNWLYLNGADQDFGGTVEITAGTLNMSAHQGTKTFDKFVNSGTTRLTNNSNSSPACWAIHELAGNGTLKVQAARWAKLDGAGDFTGTLSMEGGTLELAHEKALQNASLSIINNATLAVSADTAKVKTLSGSGTLLSGAVGDTSSTRNTTLEFTAGNATFSGSVKGDKAHGLSLLKSGTGTQTFSGSDIKLQNVSVQSGTLAFSSETAPTVYGDVNIARGATLDYKDKTLSLVAGQELVIEGGSEGVATFNGNLDFAYGSLVFASEVITADTPVLHLGGTATSSTGGAVVNFTNDGTLGNGSYKLSSGDWSALADKVSSTSLIYHTAVFEATGQGLSVTIDDRRDIQVWDGKSGKSSWNSDDFGQSENKLAESGTAVFNDSAATTSVTVGGDEIVKEMVFDNDSKKYVVVAGSGATVQVENLRQVGDGTTELMGNISMGTASVESGTLSLGYGNSAGSVTVDEDATVELKNADAVTGSVSGEGTVRIIWDKDVSRSASVGSIGTLEVQSGQVSLDSSANISRGLAIAEDGSVTVANATTWDSGVSMDVDGQLNITATQSGVVNLANAQGSGKIVLSTTSNYNNEVKVGQGDSYTGTTNLTGGRLNLNKSIFGQTLEVDNTVEMLMHTQVDLAPDVVINEGATLRIFQDSLGGTAQLDINGTLTGKGSYDRRGAAPLNVNGKVALDKFVQENDASRSPLTNFNNTVELGNLVAKSGTIRFNQEATIGASVVSGSEVIFGDSAKITDSMVLTNGNTRVSISRLDETNAAEIKGAVTSGNDGSAIRLAGNGSTSLENMAIDLAAGTRLEMDNITLSASSRITDAEATLVANGLAVEANVGSNLKPLTYGDNSPAVVQEQAEGVVSFTLSNIQDVAIEGTGLVVTMVGDYQSSLAGAEWLQLGLGADDGSRGTFSDGLAVTLQFMDAEGQAVTVQGVYSMDDVAVAAEAETQHDYVYFHLAAAAEVPEPASSTLSLLALAALAARRRRRK